MYDKQVRRRRLTLAAFVIASVLLLTVYFGEGAGGGLHSVQRGALSVLAPIQEGAHRVLKPFRDLFGWAGDTIDAKQERDELVEANERMNRELAELATLRDDNAQYKELLQINETGGMDAFEPVPALAYARSSNLFNSQVQIDKGSSAGVAVGQPVITGRGLLGRVIEVASNTAVVVLVTDQSFATGVKVQGANQQSTIVASPNNPGVLELTGVDNPDKVSRGDTVVTAGSSDPEYRSYYPRGIRIGTVSDIELGEGNLDSRIRVKPSVDLGNLEWVEVLTRPDADATVAALP